MMRCHLPIAILSLLLANLCHANGLIRDGVGARASGRGGVNLAFADTAEVLLDNPGAMTNLDANTMIAVGGDILFTDLQYGDPDNPVTNAFDNPFPMGQLAIIRNCGDIAYGVGMFAHGGFAAEYLLAGPPAFPGPRHYKALGALARIHPGVAVRLTDRLSVGGALGLGVSHIELEAPYTLQTGALQGVPTMLDLQTTGVGLSWNLGLQYQLTERTTLGVAFQNETRMILDGNARIEVPGLGETYYDAELDYVWPRSLGIGLLYEPCCCRRIAIDAVWYDWSHAFDNLDLKLTDPTDPVFVSAAPRVDDRFPLNWRDSISVRLGGEQDLGCGRKVRAGYSFHRDPIPTSTLTNHIQPTLEHVFATGYGWTFRGYELDFGYQFSFGKTRHINGSEIVGGDFEGGRIRTHVHWLALSVIRRN